MSLKKKELLFGNDNIYIQKSSLVFHLYSMFRKSHAHVYIKGCRRLIMGRKKSFKFFGALWVKILLHVETWSHWWIEILNKNVHYKINRRLRNFNFRFSFVNLELAAPLENTEENKKLRVGILLNYINRINSSTYFWTFLSFPASYSILLSLSLSVSYF